MLKPGLALLLMMSTPALAAKKKGPEVYAATEDDGGNAPISLPAKPAPAPRKAVKAVEPDLTELREAYDPVPSDQKDSIVRRLKLIEKIIREHGRAYDYRIHTNTELEAILAKLEDKPIDTGESAQ
jgi:hypothetical protein